MKKNKLLLVAATLIAMQTSACKKNNDNNNQAKVQAAIEKERVALEQALGAAVPSLSVLIETPQGRYFASTAGEGGKTITEHTNFRFASNTKNFTATAILSMMQEGWLNLDDKITGNIPGTNIPYVPAQWTFPHKNEITIKQLLQHNAGVYDVSNDTVPDCNGDSYTEYTMEQQPYHQFNATELVNLLQQYNLTYGPPNTVYHYSNTGYTMLGEIIARTYSFRAGSNKTYGDYLHDKIYGPSAKVSLKLHFADQATDRQLAAPYITGLIRYPDKTVVTDLINASAHVAEGNGCGAMNELNQYIRTLMKGENILEQSSLNLMKTAKGPAPAPGNNDYALGCFHIKNLGYGHNGATQGYLSLMVYDPDTDISVIVLLPYWDLREGTESLKKCIMGIENAGWAAREALGYPGR